MLFSFCFTFNLLIIKKKKKKCAEDSVAVLGHFPSQTKFFKKGRQTIRIFCLALMMTENLSQLINKFFGNEKIRSYLFHRFLNTLVGLKWVDNWHHYTLLAAVLKLRSGLTIVNKSSESNRIRSIQSSNSKLFDCIGTILQIRRKPKHELNGERIQWVLELLKFFCVKNRRNRYLLSDHHRFTGRKLSNCYHRF